MKESSILLIDDEQSVLDGLRVTLRRGPYTVFTANSVNKAREVLVEHKIDLVICDEMMPGQNGSSFVSELRKDNPEIVAIMLSGQATIDAVLKSLNSGEVYRFLVKPCAPADLLQTVHSALQQRDLMIQSRRLLDSYKSKCNELNELRKKFPGIEDVQKDSMGHIIIDDIGDDLDDLLGKMGEVSKDD